MFLVVKRVRAEAIRSARRSSKSSAADGTWDTDPGQPWSGPNADLPSTPPCTLGTQNPSVKCGLFLSAAFGLIVFGLSCKKTNKMLQTPSRLARNCLLVTRTLTRRAGRPAATSLTVRAFAAASAAVGRGEATFSTGARGSVQARAAESGVETALDDAAESSGSGQLLDFFATCSPGLEVSPASTAWLPHSALLPAAPLAARSEVPYTTRCPWPAAAQHARVFLTPNHQSVKHTPPHRFSDARPHPPPSRYHHTPQSVVAAELSSKFISARDVQEGSAGVSFRGSRSTGYRANLWLRSAIRVLVRLAAADLHIDPYTQGRRGGDAVYDFVKAAAPWAEVIPLRCARRDATALLLRAHPLTSAVHAAEIRVWWL